MVRLNQVPIVDHNGNHYTMFVRAGECFGVKRVLLCIENSNEQLNTHYNKFNTLVIDTLFCMLVDESTHCSEEYINYILQYIVEHKEQVNNILEDFLSSDETNHFLSQIYAPMRNYAVDNVREYSVVDPYDVLRLTCGTEQKQFFVLDEYNHFRQVGLHIAASLFGVDTLIQRCRELDFLNGMGHNGRAAWLDGLAIRDIARDRFNGGWCC